MIRLFAAIALPETIGQPLQTRQAGIPGARWRPLEALHVTLRFFGEISPTRAEDLDEQLRTVSLLPFDLHLAGVGCFGEGVDIRSIWAGVEVNPALTRLAKACEAAARRAGLEPDRRVFRPHVTLAYLKRPNPDRVADWIAEHNLLLSPSFRVSRFGLYSSHLGSSGSTYQLEASYPA